MEIRHLALRASLAGALLLAAGCADPGTSQEPGAGSGASAESSESPDPMDEDSGGISEPVAPPAEQTEAGAEAFARYAVESAYYSFVVNDTTLLEQTVVGEDCTRCQALAKAAERRRAEGLTTRFKESFAVGKVSYEGRTGKTWTVFVDVRRPAYHLVDKTGKVVARSQSEPLASEEVSLRWVDGKWGVVDISGFVDD